MVFPLRDDVWRWSHLNTNINSLLFLLRSKVALHSVVRLWPAMTSHWLFMTDATGKTHLAVTSLCSSAGSAHSTLKNRRFFSMSDLDMIILPSNQAPKTSPLTCSYGAYSESISFFIKPKKTKYKPNKQNFSQTRMWGAGKSWLQWSLWSCHMLCLQTTNLRTTQSLTTFKKYSFIKRI